MNALTEALSLDPDPTETAEWREAFVSLAAHAGPSRARFMLDELVRLARSHQIDWRPDLNTPYVNTIAAHAQPPFPGDLAIEERLASLMRWNALAMVARANKAYGELGGHIASYASAADLFEVGFNHFFHAREGLGAGQHRGDLVFSPNATVMTSRERPGTDAKAQPELQFRPLPLPVFFFASREIFSCSNVVQSERCSFIAPC